MTNIRKIIPYIKAIKTLKIKKKNFFIASSFTSIYDLEYK
jgi:hypothetical protein